MEGAPDAVTRVLPAQLVVAVAVAGLALANLLRVDGRDAAVLAATSVATLAAVRSARLWLVVALAFCLGWWWGSARLAALDRSVLTAQVGRAEDGVAVTTAEARPGTFVARQFARLRVFGQLRLDERVELELPLGRAPPQGAVIRLLAVVKAPNGPDHGFDERTWLRRQGVHVVLKVDRWEPAGRRGGVGGFADGLRRWLARASTPGLRGERLALVEGVLLGDENGLSDRLKNAFRRSGLFHLLAVSGENVVLLAGGVLAVVLVLGFRRVFGHVAALGAILGYLLAVGPQPSVIRAAVSGAAISVAWLLGRERDRWHVLLLAALVLLGWNPYTVYDAGFQLSFVAVVAIFVFGRPLFALLEGVPLPEWIRSALAIAVACTIATTPILWLQFGQVPLLGVVANVLAEPAMPLLLALAFGAAVVDPVSPALAGALAYLNGWVAAYVAAVARLVSSVPGAQVTGRGAEVAGLLAVGGLAFAARALRRMPSA
jgi:competence protein ComEC